MDFNLIEENGYKYIEEGEGFPIIILHGLMGNLSNFNLFITTWISDT